MDYIQKLLKKSGLVGILESLIFGILGAILIANPEETVRVISYILGAIFIFIGIYKIINYIKENGQADLYNYNLIYGIMAIVIGLITIIYSTTVGTIFRIVIGIWIIYSAAVRASSAVKLKNLNSNTWIYALVLSLVMLGCGLYIALVEGTIIVIVGVLMIIYAVIDILENIIFIKNLDKIS